MEISNIDQLKDHYKHCIRLSASNKINTKNAFDLQLIDFMQNLIEDGPMNFKVASSALDVGAKIYSNRVDYIQSEAQKVASGIIMALDGQQSKKDETDTQLDANTSNNSDSREKAPKKKLTNHKSIKTVIDEESTLDAKLETMASGDSLSQDHDVSEATALISLNSMITNPPACLMNIESNVLRISNNNQPEEHNTLKGLVNLFCTLNCGRVIRKYHLISRLCSKMENFLFDDRKTTINSNPDPADSRVCDFDQDVPIDCGDDPFVDAETIDENDLLPNLDRIGASKPTDYGYSHEHSRLLDTWAGPHAWKAAKAPQSTRKNAAPQSTRKRAKLEQKPIDFEEGFSTNLEEVVDKNIRHSKSVIRGWRKGFIPEDHNLTGEKVRNETLVRIYNKPEDTYHCVITPADALKLVDKDHDYSKNDDREIITSPGLGGFDDVHDDSDDEFRADPVEGNELAIYNEHLDTTVIQQDLEFAGENLIEQPYTVAHVNIPFAKVAKKMDVGKLKRVMWDLILPDTTGPSPSPSPAKFSNLYGELPKRVSSRMAKDLSQPIVFVTLLHLANEKNLELKLEQDLKDFTIG